jgi:transcription initiation factor IIE alpha subunit
METNNIEFKELEKILENLTDKELASFMRKHDYVNDKPPAFPILDLKQALLNVLYKRLIITNTNK